MRVYVPSASTKKAKSTKQNGLASVLAPTGYPTISVYTPCPNHQEEPPVLVQEGPRYLKIPPGDISAGA